MTRKSGPCLTVGWFCLLLGASSGCGDDRVECSLPARVTYRDDIAPMVERNCLRCHSKKNEGADRNAAPVGVNFDSYRDIYPWADKAAERVAAQTMPPDAALDPCAMELFVEWVHQGKRQQ